MNAATTIQKPAFALPEAHVLETTLLDLVRAVSDECANEAEVVATVLHMLGTGRARLCGTLRGTSLRELCES